MFVHFLIPNRGMFLFQEECWRNKSHANEAREKGRGPFRSLMLKPEATVCVCAHVLGMCSWVLAKVWVDKEEE